MFDPQMESFLFEKREECLHPNTEFSTDNSCGAWFETCLECHEIIKSGMIGHN